MPFCAAHVRFRPKAEMVFLIYRDEPVNTAVCQNFLHSNVMKSPSAFWGTRTRWGFHLPERTQRYTELQVTPATI